MNVNDYIHNVSGETPYSDVLKQVQNFVSRECPSLINKDNMTNDDTYNLRKHIENFITSYNIKCKDAESIDDVVTKVYNDMVGFSFLTDYLSDKKVKEMGIEEINVNSWDCIYLKTKNGKIKIPETFNTPQHAIDIVQRILRRSGSTIDNAMPMCLGQVKKNVRIAAIKAPVLDEEVGIAVSIRIVNFSELTDKDLIDNGTANEDMINCLLMFLKSKTSIVICGETGCGKTGTIGMLLDLVTQDDTYRVLTVEEGSRELNLVKRDENGNVINDVVHMITRPSELEKYNIDQDYILEFLLRFDGDIIGAGEMRSKESFTVAEASTTNHTTITTVHALSAEDAYSRMVVLAKKAHSYDDKTLYNMMIKAFPIICFQEFFPDGSRKITKIIEGLGLNADNTIRYNTLWEYEVSNIYWDNEDKIHVQGQFIKKDNLSEKRYKLISSRGTDKKLLEYLFGRR